MKREVKKHKATAVRHWEARKKKYDFVKSHLHKILSLSITGWPRMTLNPDYLKWLDIVYQAKDQGLFSLKTGNADVIWNLHNKAQELQVQRKEEINALLDKCKIEAKPGGRNPTKGPDNAKGKQ